MQTNDPPRQNWFLLALIGLLGTGVGIACGILIASTGGKAKELPPAPIVATATAVRASPVPKIAPAAREAKPRESETWLRLQKAYGPSSQIVEFLDRLAATKAWNPETAWLLRGNPATVGGEASGLLVSDPISDLLVGRLSVAASQDSKDVFPTLEWEVAAVWGIANGFGRPNLLVGGFEAVGKAMQLDDKESRRLARVAAFIPIITPAKMLEKLDRFSGSLPSVIAAKFRGRLTLLTAEITEGDRSKLLLSEHTEPSINFALSSRRLACVVFGNWSKGKIPATWTVEITPRDSFYKEPAWCELNEDEVEALSIARISRD